MANGRGSVKVALQGQTGGVGTSYNYYVPKAVVIPGSGYLLDEPSSISDTPYLSGSFWFLIPSFPPTNVPPYGALNLCLISSTTSNVGANLVFNANGISIGFEQQTGPPYSSISIVLASTAITTGLWHHVAFSVDANHKGSGHTFNDPCVAQCFLDGVQQTVNLAPWGGINYPPDGPCSLAMSGQSIGVPNLPTTYKYGSVDSANSPVYFADYQLWIGTFIDFTGTYGGGIVVNASQSATAYGTVPNIGLMQNIVNAALAAGLSPVNVLTAFNMETAYGTQTSGGVPVAYKMPANSYNGDRVNAGIFQMERVDLAVALGGFTYSGPPANWTISDYAGTLINSNDLQTKAYIAATMNPLQPGTQLSYMAGALKWRSADPTGVYAYVGHNQGMSNTSNTGGQDIVLKASSGTSIGSLSIASNMLGQSWSRQAGLTNSSTVGQWLGALTTAWNAAQADAASRLTGTAQNIDAFFSGIRTPVPTIVSTLVFGKPTIMFSGDHTTFPNNQGTSGESFTVINGPLTDAIPPS